VCGLPFLPGVSRMVALCCGKTSVLGLGIVDWGVIFTYVDANKEKGRKSGSVY
jgi:hypothetical protein